MIYSNTIDTEQNIHLRSSRHEFAIPVFKNEKGITDRNIKTDSIRFDSYKFYAALPTLLNPPPPPSHFNGASMASQAVIYYGTISDGCSFLPSDLSSLL